MSDLGLLAEVAADLFRAECPPDVVTAAEAEGGAPALWAALATAALTLNPIFLAVAPSFMTDVPSLLLLLLALLTVLFPVLDIIGTARSGMPADHTAAYQSLAGRPFPGIQPAGPTRYIRQLEYGYALHELTFALFFVILVAIPLRTGQRWAWLACWLILIATIGYTLTIAHYSGKTLAYSLIPAIAIPLLLLAEAPRFWKR
jgi:hypothetical protein